MEIDSPVVLVVAFALVTSSTWLRKITEKIMYMDAGRERTLIVVNETYTRNPSLCCIINDDLQEIIIFSIVTAYRRSLSQSFETFPRSEYLTSAAKMQICFNFVSFVYAMAIRFIYY